MLLFVSSTFFWSCGQRTESNLSKEDIEYINALIPLEEGEKIELFETNGGLKGFKTAGNFITNRRIAHYWVDDNGSDIQALTYDQIDTLKLVDRTEVATYASFIEVFGVNQTSFKVYVDAGGVRTAEFFARAMENWEGER